VKQRHLVVASLALFAIVLPGCLNARVGQRCATTDFGRDATHLLRCQRGRWVRVATIEQVTAVVINILKARSTNTMARPPTSTSPTALPASTVPATPTTTSVPPAVLTSISSGYEHTCSVKSGVVRCVGSNGYGSLGTGVTGGPSSTAWLPTGITDATSVELGSQNGCALRSNGSISCWGSGEGGELGNSDTVNSNVPSTVSGITNAVQVSMGPNGGCARLATAAVRWWGSGYGASPVEVPGPSATSIDVGELHRCARTTGGGVVCWGANNVGQLGDNSTNSSSTPVPVVGLTSGLIGIGAGRDVSCAVRADGTVWCWGDGSGGALGNGSSSGFAQQPVKVSGITNAAQVAVGFYHACARLSTGQVKCWGSNSVGQLGTGDATPSPTPVLVSGLSTATALSAGAEHTCALVSGDAAVCWGRGGEGQLGQGAQTSSNVPAAVLGLP